MLHGARRHDDTAPSAHTFINNRPFSMKKSRRKNLHPTQAQRRCSTRNLIFGCAATISFLHVYLIATMTVKDDTSIKSSYQSKSMGHFRRNKKSDTIDFPELDETNQNVPIDAGIGHTQVDVEAKEESALQNIVNPQHIEERAQSLQVSQLVDTAKVDIIGANESSSLPKVTIAYGKWIQESTVHNYSNFIFLILIHSLLLLAVSLTSCGASNMADGAAVLKHSIALSSYPLNKNSKYAYKIFAFVHPQAVECSEPFEKLGYEVQIRETPIDASKIRGEFLREHVVKTGAYMTQ